MKIKTSLISQLFDIVLIILITIILLILHIEYNVNVFEISPISVFYFSLLVIALFILDGIIIRRLYTYEIDEAGVRESFIIFSKRETLIPYNNITKIDLKKSFIGRIFNYGDIEIVGPSTAKIVLRGIKNPEKVYKEIKGMLEKYKNAKYENE
ncbi:MAG: PH domain-containing protein [Candidatus Aenigmatarchaeota archaeon]